MPLRRRTLVCALSAALSGIGAEIFGLAGFIPPLVGVGGWFALAVDVGPFFRVFGVDVEPFLGVGLGIGNDGLDPAFRFSDAAIDAFFGMDDQHVLAFVETIDGAHFDAIHQFAFDAVLVDDVGHGFLRCPTGS